MRWYRPPLTFEQFCEIEKRQKLLQVEKQKEEFLNIELPGELLK